MRRAVLVAACLLFAGCVSEPSDTVFGVPEDAPSVDDTYVGDGYDLRVRVVDQDGATLAGVGVVYYLGNAGSASGGGGGSCGMDGCTGDLWWEGDSGKEEVLAGLRTDPQGEAVADLKPGRSVHVAAGGLPGYTTEVKTNVAVGSAGNAGTITITLYPESIEHTFPVTVDNMVGSTQFQGPSYQAFDAIWSDDALLDAAYEDRIFDVTITATWSNGPMGAGDLYVGLGGKQTPHFEGDDERNLEPGSHTESLHVSRDDLLAHRGDIDAFHVFMMTDYAGGGFSGLPVEIHVEATLKGSNVRIE